MPLVRRKLHCCKTHDHACILHIHVVYCITGHGVVTKLRRMFDASLYTCMKFTTV
jgi:transcriptional regulatory protein LevR